MNRVKLLIPAAAALLGLATAPASADAFRLQASVDAPLGVDAIASGRYDAAEARAELLLDLAGTARQLRAPALTNLCVARAMQGEFDAAREACDASIQVGWEAGVALNNRGVVNAARGDYDAAIRDFEAALEIAGSRRTARHNLALARQRLAARAEGAGGTSVAANPVAADSQGG